MSRRCPNCDQRLLEDERVCWQCGARLEDPVEAVPAEPEKSAAHTPFVPYLAITIFVVLAALLLTSFLGRQPRIRISPASLPEGWMVITDQARYFSVFLPEEWRTLEAGSADNALGQLISGDTVYGRSLEPLGGFVNDEEIIFLSTGAQPSTFFLVARSPVLNRLSTTDAVELANEGNVDLLDARRIESQGRSQAALRIGIEQADSGDLICRQRFVPGGQAALLFSLCSPRARLDDQMADTLLSSIQKLR